LTTVAANSLHEFLIKIDILKTIFYLLEGQLYSRIKNKIQKRNAI